MANLEDRIKAAAKNGLYEPMAYHVVKLVLAYKRVEFYWKHPEATRKEMRERMCKLIDLFEARIDEDDTIRIYDARQFRSQLIALKYDILCTNDMVDNHEVDFVMRLMKKCHYDYREDCTLTPFELIYLIQLEDKYKKWGREKGE